MNRTLTVASGDSLDRGGTNGRMHAFWHRKTRGVPSLEEKRSTMATRGRSMHRDDKSKLPRSQSGSNPRKANELARKLAGDVHTSTHCQHVIFATMAVFSIQLPPFTRTQVSFRKMITSILVDSYMQHTLEEARVINWCRTTKTLYPLSTKGDGNCLLHAASIYMWGIHDSGLFLRRLIHKVMVEDCDGREFRSRWQKEKGYLNSVIPNGGLQYNSKEWDDEWNMVMLQADDYRQSMDPDVLPYKSLEEIHIFVLANILHRTIIVQSEGVIRTIEGNSIALNNVGGIYLPTLCSPGQCFKSPVVLCYSDNHFTPLISMEDLYAEGQIVERSVHAVPLVTVNSEQLPVHFLSQHEEANISDLLNQFLELVELPCSQNDKIQVVLCAKLTHIKLPNQYNLMEDFYRKLEVRYMENAIGGEQLPNPGQSTSPKRPTGGPDPMPVDVGPEPNEGFSLPEITVTSRPEKCEPQNDVMRTSSARERQQQEMPLVAEVQHLAIQESQPCVTPGCEFHGLPENGGRCSGCINDYTRQSSPKTPSAPKQSLPPLNGHPHLLRSFSDESRIRNRSSSFNNSMSDLPCQMKNCRHVASWQTYPYCHIHKPVGTGQQERGVRSSMTEQVTRNPEHSTSMRRHNSHSLESVQCIHSPQQDPRRAQEKGRTDTVPGHPSGDLPGHITDPSLCQNIRCPNRCSPLSEGFCHSCYRERTRSQHRIAVSEGTGVLSAQDTRNINRSQQGVRTFDVTREKLEKQDYRAATQELPKILCSTPGCQGMRLNNPHDMCLICLQNAHDPGQDRILGFSRDETVSRQGHGSSSVRNHTEPLMRASPKTYLPRELHSVPAEGSESAELMSYQQQLDEHAKCVNPACDQHGYESYNGLCPECYNHLMYRCLNLTSETPGSPGKVPTGMKSGPQRESFPAVGESLRCSTPGCRMYASSETGRYCSRCFLNWTRENQWENYDIPPSNAQRSPPTTGRCSPMEGGVVVVASPCRNPQCDKYGDDALNGFCSKCYFESGSHHDPAPPGIPVRYRPYDQVPPFHGPKWNAASQATASSEAALPRYLHGPSRQDQPLLSNKMSLAKCRNPVCNNYGNQHCRGYCNTCHVAIRSSLYDH